MTQQNNTGQPGDLVQIATKPNGLSSSGIHILSSMPATSDHIAAKTADHEKPGYQICAYVDDFIKTDAGMIPRIKTKPDIKDFFSTVFVRCGIHRNDYRVSPGLYCVGSPDEASDVLVTANFKLTFDHLRRELRGMNVWILVLDTNGINVWCAAGKGTFSTSELVRRITLTGLDKLVNHKRLILPQLSATGVNAWQVKKDSGFKVEYGPVRAKDIPAFITNNRQADPDMRQVTFTLLERFLLTPLELSLTLKPAVITAIVLFILSLVGPSGSLDRGVAAMITMITGIVSGAVITPVLLPILPGRAFAVKGVVTGSVAALIMVGLTRSLVDSLTGYAALFLFSVTLSSALAMNFTGSTPYTSPSGVEKEMKRYMPLQIAALILAAGLWLYSAF